MKARTTEILLRSRAGDRDAVDHLTASVYDELKSLAASYLHGRSRRTLTPTALVHEAYFRLVDQSRVEWQDRAHFIGVAAHLMRRALLEHARRARAQKRGGDRLRVTFHEALAADDDSDVDLLALEEALSTLEQRDARKAKVVELRFYGGLTMQEAADVLGISKKTVEADWYFARAWLSAALGERERAAE
ncbi:MAG: ECF-type sigma factor [Planctomycetota bacterium]